MSPVAKAAVERLLIALRATQPAFPSRRGSWRGGTLHHFGMEDAGPVDPTVAGQVPSPAVRHLVDDGAVFEVDGDYYTVDRVIPSGSDPQADVLVLDGYEHVDGDERTSRRALQVRDIEALIIGDRVDLPFIGSARRYNLDRGWGNGGPTLDSLGLLTGGDA